MEISLIIQSETDDNTSFLMKPSLSYSYHSNILPCIGDNILLKELSDEYEIFHVESRVIYPKSDKVDLYGKIL